MFRIHFVEHRSHHLLDQSLVELYRFKTCHEVSHLYIWDREVVPKMNLVEHFKVFFF